MEVITQLIYLLRQFTALIWAINYLVALLKEMFFMIEQLFKSRQPIGFQSSRQKPQPSRRGKWSKSYLNDPKNRALQHELLSLLHGDTPTAKRLLKQQRQMHPGQSDNWYLEKVIDDIKRDRRCR